MRAKYSLIIVVLWSTCFLADDSNLKTTKTDVCSVLRNPGAYNGKTVELEGDLYFQFERSELTAPGCNGAIWVDRSAMSASTWSELKQHWGVKTHARVVGKIKGPLGNSHKPEFGHLGAYLAEVIVQQVSLL